MNQDINRMDMLIIYKQYNSKTIKNKVRICKIWYKLFWLHLDRREVGLNSMTIKKISNIFHK